MIVFFGKRYDWYLFRNYMSKESCFRIGKKIKFSNFVMNLIYSIKVKQGRIVHRSGKENKMIYKIKIKRWERFDR